jgi:hypothetical protein
MSSTKSFDPRTSPARHIALTIGIPIMGIKKYDLFFRFRHKIKKRKKLKTLR